MVSHEIRPSSHGDEEESSERGSTSPVHWTFAAVRLLQAAREIANGYLREERDDVRACIDADHHEAVRTLFDAIQSADSTGLALACAELHATSTGEPLQLWTLTGEEYEHCTLGALLESNSWLSPGDVVHGLTGIPFRRVLVERDFTRAAAPAVIGASA